MDKDCQDKVCQDKVAWELQVKMPRLAQVGVKNQVMGAHVKCRVHQVNAEFLRVKDRLGQDRLEACAWPEVCRRCLDKELPVDSLKAWTLCMSRDRLVNMLVMCLQNQKSGYEHCQFRMLASGPVEKLKSLDGKHTFMISRHGLCSQSVSNSEVR